jgi:hypothetical protein
MFVVMPTALLHRDAPRRGDFATDAERCWTADSLARDGFDASFAVPDAVNDELRDALAHARANGLSLDTVEQEDIRLPSLARHVAALRARLDAPPGILVLRGIDLAGLDDDAAGIVAWGIANYLGRPIRQGLTRDRRLFTVTNQGAANTDAIRIGASSRESWPHTDNACLELRPPAYIGLLCVQDALAGGDSTVISAASILQAVGAEDAGLAAELFAKFHFLPPQLHTWPAGPPTIAKPILEWVDGTLHIHYARVMIEPGMVKAGTPLSDRQRAALDLLDSVIARPKLAWTTRLAPGDFLFVDNLANLHGRRAFTDDDAAGRRRVLKRVWLWRRHAGPGDDPAALDLAELH